MLVPRSLASARKRLKQSQEPKYKESSDNVEGVGAEKQNRGSGTQVTLKEMLFPPPIKQPLTLSNSHETGGETVSLIGRVKPNRTLH